MTNQTTRRGQTQQMKKAVIKQEIIDGLVSPSSTHAITQVPGKRQAWKSLKRVQGLSNFITTRGFTLIELLVVVLIIGILTAVALPQYNKAVLKARTVELINVLNAGQKAIDAWVLENGYKDASPDDFVLDIPIPSTLLGGMSCEEHYQDCGMSFVPNFGGNILFTNTNFEWTRTCDIVNNNDEIVCNLLKQSYPDMTITGYRN